MCRWMYALAMSAMVSGWTLGCGSSDETAADRAGVGAECNASAECESPNEDIPLVCLPEFKGGYCGLEGCEGDADCPEGSGCVAYSDGDLTGNYCFRLCQDKPECNRNRSAENESNCSSNITWVDPPQERKACVPPSAGL